MKKRITLLLALATTIALSSCSIDSKLAQEEQTTSEQPTQETTTEEPPTRQILSEPTAFPQGGGSTPATTERQTYALDEFDDVPGTTMDGAIDDKDAVDAVFQYFFASTDFGVSEMSDMKRDMFIDYIFKRKLKISDAEKEKMFDVARDLGMFRAFNEPALKQDEKYEVIILYLVSAYDIFGTGSQKLDRSFDREKITFDRTKKLPTAILKQSDITMNNDGDAIVGTAEDFTYYAIRYKGNWYVSKQSLDGSLMELVEMGGQLLK